MADTVLDNRVWIRSLGSAWKVRARSAEVAEQVRRALSEQGWKCTAVSAAFDVRDTVLFRVTDTTGQRHRSLDDSVRQIAGIALMNDPA